MLEFYFNVGNMLRTSQLEVSTGRIVQARAWPEVKKKNSVRARTSPKEKWKFLSETTRPYRGIEISARVRPGPLVLSNS